MVYAIQKNVRSIRNARVGTQEGLRECDLNKDRKEVPNTLLEKSVLEVGIFARHEYDW